MTPCAAPLIAAVGAPVAILQPALALLALGAAILYFLAKSPVSAAGGALWLVSLGSFVPEAGTRAGPNALILVLMVMTGIRCRLALSHVRDRTRWLGPVIVVHALATVVYSAWPSSVALRVAALSTALVAATVLFSTGPATAASQRLLLRIVVGLAIAQVSLAVLQVALKRPFLMEAQLGSQSLAEASNLSGQFRAIGTFQHANSLSLFLVVLLLISLAYVTSTQLAGDRALATVAVVICVLGVALTLSRLGILSVLLIGLGVLLKRPRTALRVVPVFTAALLCLSVLAPVLLSQTTDRFLGTSDRVASRDAGSGVARDQNRQAGVRAFLERPLTGWGAGTAERTSAQFGGYTGYGPHNTYVDVAQGGGVIGLALWGLLLAHVGRRALTGRKTRPVTALFFTVSCVAAAFEVLLDSTLPTMLIVGAFVVYNTEGGERKNVSEPGAQIASRRHHDPASAGGRLGSAQ